MATTLFRFPPADSRHLVPRLLDAWAWAVLALTVVFTLVVILTVEREIWVDLIYDDAYYYLGLARGIVDLGASVFLPPYETNGYQPLWMAVLSVSAWLFGTGDTALVVQVVVLSFVFVALFGYASRRLHGLAWPALWVILIYDMVGFRGMETAMMPLWVVLFFHTRREAWQLRGTLGSLIFLTRLDALSLIVVRDFYHLVFMREGLRDLKHWLIVGPVLLAYAAFNQLYYGTPLPVSGMAKAVGNVPFENIAPLVAMLAISHKPIIAATLMAGLALFVFKRRLRYAREISVCLLALVVCAGYYSVLSGWRVWPWYFWPGAMLAYYTVLELVAAFGESRPRGRVAIIGLLIVAFNLHNVFTPLAYLGELWQRSPWRTDTTRIEAAARAFPARNAELAARIRAGLIPEGSLLVMGDRAGSLGFFLGPAFRFLHSEGLVASLDYYRAYREGRGLEFVLDARPDHYVSDREVFFEDAQHLGFIEPVQGVSSHVGPYLLCFAKSGVVAVRQAAHQTQHLIDFKAARMCPDAFVERFEYLKSRCNGVREFSLPSEYSSIIFRAVRHHCDRLYPRAGPG